MYCCENGDLIRNQREEIILLTGELKSQEEQLYKLNAANLKLNENVKLLENTKVNLEKQLQTLNKEISLIKTQLSEKTDELEKLKQKMQQKDTSIQSHLNKTIQLQSNIDKLNSEIKNLKKENSELKSENLKNNLKLKDQSSRILELKERNNELMKTLESNNNLVKNSTERIQNFEKVLNSLLNQMKLVKGNQNKQLNKIEIDEKSTNETKQTDFLQSTKISIIDNKDNLEQEDHGNNTKKILSSSSNTQLTSLLKSIRETWLESNLKYEEVKDILNTKFKENEIITATNVEVDVSKRQLTSSPISFKC